MIEIQYHPANKRSPVRKIVLGRRGLAMAVVAGSLLLAFFLASLASLPSVVRRAYRTAHLEMARQERAVQSQKLREHVDRMAALEKVVDQRRIRIEKLIAVYGLRGSAPGQGGLATPPGATGDALVDARRQEAFLRSAVTRLDGQLAVLARFEKENDEMIRHTPAILPIPADQFVVTHTFGWRISPFTKRQDFHAGLDLAAPAGTPIVATADGTVTFAGRYPMRRSTFWWRFGNVVAIDHAGRFVTVYAYCDDVNVRRGQTVRQGEVIGTVGSSGWSTNAHLYYEVRTDLESAGQFRPVDPQIYILNYQWGDAESILDREPVAETDVFEPMPREFLASRRR